MTDRDGLMDFAARTLRAAGELTLAHFGRAAVEYKSNQTEVTAADLAAEAHVRAAIAEAFPEDGILGEEEDDVPSRSGRRWIVDPIDGTRSFAVGVPLYSMLLALEEDGAPVLGCIHLPVTRQTLVAATGAGAWMNGERARVSECDALSDARLVTSGFEYWRDSSTDEHRAGFERLVKATRFARTWGDGYGYFLVATGRVELYCDPICGAAWDIAPMNVILAEAGGRISRFDGQPIAPMTSVLAGNPHLHEAAARMLLAGS
ncbi:inositol monophosphatase family protein [Longimicrobium sp.]|uniref:inositol monophosphatase family protein n=1 Tax=Longimicrobium sp. TaxID=2029185 RepID=UPI002C9E12C7|nr:inositol monophosphatase family protein [Longimicrobium sp.]HSU14552.1 inositol monophosphatase family protein [Longimicrobium sp.]